MWTLARKIFLGIFWAISAHAAADEVGSLSFSEVSAGPATVIGGCVNAITGTYSEQQTDVLLKGIEPLAFQRYYNSSDWSGGYLCDGWGHNFGCLAIAKLDTNNYCQVLYPHLSGGGVLFQGNQPARDGKHGRSLPRQDCFCTLHNAQLEIGLTNCSSGEISGRTNLKSATIRLTPSASIYAKSGDGSVRTFVPAFTDHNKVLPMTFLAVYDKKASGNAIQYDYHRNHALKRLETRNAQGKLLNWIELDYGPQRTTSIRTSEGKTIQYHTTHHLRKGEHAKKGGRYRISQVVNPNQPLTQYQYSSDKTTKEQMIRKSKPDGRFLEVSYWGAVKGAPHWLVGRVAELRAPVGTDATPITTHRISYPDESRTEVRDALNHKTSYQSVNKRITQITRYTETDTPYSTDQFYWGDQNTIHRSNMTCRALLDSAGNILSCRCLHYDITHNITEETLCGNLSGHSFIQPLVNPCGNLIENGCERVSTYYTYSNDGFNLLLSERESNGRTTHYQYKPDTDLLIARLLSDGKQIVSREFHTYNEDAVRIRSVVDDGCGMSEGDLTGVTMRRIQIVEPRMEMPGIGLPLVTEQRYLDLETGQEQQLSRQVNHYNKELLLAKQDHYDADNQLRYSLTWEYDALGNITKETNALGQITQRQFDANGNQTFEQKPGHGFSTHYTYDFANRCISEEQIYPDGVKRAHTFNYNPLGQKVAEVDFMGHETRYLYDAFHRLIATQLPDNVTSRQEYDLYGNVIAKIDANGNRTEMRYNICGKVAEIRNPDGSYEQFVYNPDGTLARSTAINGLETLYTYDTLKHVIRKACFSPEGILLSTISATYQGDLLRSETDANGNVTTYTYDGAGRKTGVYQQDRHVTFAYDAMGRQHLTIERSGGQSRITRTLTDLIGRITEERIEEENGSPLQVTRYTYDTFGNQTEVTQLIGPDQTPATTLTDYDADKRPIRITNPLGQVTRIEYDYTLRNQSGQQLFQKRTTDPMGNQIWQIHNALGRVVEELHKNALGQVTAKRKHRYDPNGNLIETTETVIQGVNTHDITAQFTYDSMNRTIATIEALGTPEQRTRQQSYNRFGQQEAILMPDVALYFTYDAAGRLQEYRASDGTVDYVYCYDPNGNVTQVDDRCTSTTTLRTYDSANRIKTEILGNGLSLSYEYDGFGRVLKLTLPDESAICYTYNPLSMETVSRVNAKGETLYTHTYQEYDLAGRSRKSLLIGNAGEVTYTTDLLGRPLTLTHAHISEQIPFNNGYDAASNLLKRQLQDPLGTTECDYQYDDLYQLTRESGMAEHTYLHDSLNNRLEKDGDSYQVNALNELQKTGAATYQYNPRGCRITAEKEGQTTDYQYDALNRLIAVETAEQKLTYTYDSFNRRLTATQMPNQWLSRFFPWMRKERRFLYVGQDDIGTVDASGQLTELRLLGTGRGAEIGATVAVELAGTAYAALSDSTGNLVALIDAATGQFTEGYRYSAFGEVTSYTNSWWSTTPTGNPWQFSGKRVDPETDFVFFGRRYYDPALGRFVTPDPLGFKAGPNLYAYVANNPLTHFDLYGLMDEYRGAQVLENLGQVISALGMIAGNILEGVGRHIIFIPGVHEGITGLSFVLQGRPFNGCSQCREHPSQPLERGNQELAPDSRVTSCNGIMTTLWDGIMNNDELSGDLLGSVVHACYSATYGFVLDLVESGALMLGFRTQAVYELADIWKKNLREMDAAGYTAGRIRHIAHSQGGQITWAARQLMSNEDLQRIDVETYGTAKIIPEGVFGRATNYISRRDGIPLIACPYDYVCARMGLIPNVEFIEGQGIPFCDHAFLDDTYGSKLRERNQRYMERIQSRRR